MDTVVVRQFLGFFQDFLNLCQLENWPNNETTEHEIRNAFIIATHIEKCLVRLQKNNLIDEFLSALNNTQENSKYFLRNSFSDPAKYVLKKIINSKTKIEQMDISIKIFLELYSDEKLENCLTDLILEAASKETLLRCLSTEIPKANLLEFKSQLLLSELNICGSPTDVLTDLLKNSNQTTVELLVVSMLNKDFKYTNIINMIANAFAQIMLSKDQKHKNFWKFLFAVDEKHLQLLGLYHADVFKLVTKALLDIGKLLREQMSTEYFYIDLTYSELVDTVRKICNNENLKLEFLGLVRQACTDVEFWKDMIS